MNAETIIPEVPLNERRFRLLEWGGFGDGNDVLGGWVMYRNAYVSQHGAANAGQKAPSGLDIGESSILTYRLSGQTGQYRLVRVA